MLNKKLEITDEFVMMLNHAKMICVLNKIDFNQSQFHKLRDTKMNESVSIKVHKIEDLVFSAYLASDEIRKSNKAQLKNHILFLNQLDNIIDKIYVLPTFK